VVMGKLVFHLKSMFRHPGQMEGMQVRKCANDDQPKLCI